MNRFFGMCLVATLATISPVSTCFGQAAGTNKKPPTAMLHPMVQSEMKMEKAREMAAPAMMKKVGEMMMANDEMPAMMAHEMSMAATMAKPESMEMIAAHANMITPSEKPIITDEDIKAAIRKVFSDPTQFQALLQAMIARETATAMMQAEPTMAAPMMAGEPAMIEKAKESMMMEKAMMTEKLAKEMMIQAMSQDEKIMAAVKETAMSAVMPVMKGMMKDEKMMMAKESMAEPAMQTSMMQDVMIRTMAKPDMATPKKK